MKLAKWTRSNILVFLIYIVSFQIILINTSTISSACDIWLPFDDTTTQEAPDVTLIESDIEETSFSVHFFGASAPIIEQNGTSYTALRSPGCGIGDETGKPEIPSHTQLVVIPCGAQPEVQIINTTSKTLPGYNVYPLQEPGIDLVGAQEPPFIKDEDAYQVDAFYPAEIVQVEDVKIIRGISYVLIRLFPVQYNPVTKELKVYSDICVKLVHSGGNLDIPFGSKTMSKEDMVFFESLFLNSSVLDGLVDIDAGANDYNFLIITPPDFVYGAKGLAQWKKQKGIRTKVVTTDITGTTASEIKSYIEAEYNNYNIGYVLLFGDAEFIPPHYKTVHPYHNIKTGTDLYYATVHGTDYIPDIKIGRIPVNTSTEAETVINKIINYEKNPVSDPNFYENISVAAYFQDGSWWSPPDGFEDRRFVLTSEEIRDFLLLEGYSVERIYTTKSTITPTNYNNGSYGLGLPLPPELLRANSFQWNGDRTDITNAINSGRLIVNHRNHGTDRNAGDSFTGWGDPYFDHVDVDALTNGDLLPIIFSINCATGWFDGETDEIPTRNYESFSEFFLLQPDGGAVGVIGSTRVSYSGYNDDMTKGFYDAIWPDFIPTYGSDLPIYRLGQVLNYGKIYMSTLRPEGTIRKTEFEEFHYFGDPTMEICTDVPQDFTVVHDSVIPIGASSYTLQIPEDGALVSLVKDHEILGTAVSIGGSAIVYFEKPIDAGVIIQVTVTKHNFRPYLGKIRILSEGSFLTKNSIAYDTHNNRYLLVYKFDKYIYGQLKNFDGKLVGDKFVISDSDAIDDRRYPSVAYDRANQKFLVVWTDLRNRETTITDIYGQIVNADGTRNNDNFVVSKAYNFQDRPSAAYDSTNQRFLVVWQDYRDIESTKYDIYGQIVDAEGNPYGANFVISNADSNQVFPSVAYDSANQRFLVVWSEYRNWRTTGYDIYGQIVRADGNPYGGELIISNHEKDQVSPSVAYDSANQRFLVVWSDGRGGESTTYDIYGRILDTVGNFYTDDFVISKAVQFQSTPSAAYDSANQKFLVVWSDYRNVKYRELEYQEIPNSDIYGQIVQGDGNLYGGNLAISDADGGQRSPSVAYNSNIENFLVAFNTYKTDKPAEMGFAFYIWSDLSDLSDLLDRDNIDFEPIISTFITSTDNSGCPEEFVGKFYFDARLTNTNKRDISISDLTVVVRTITKGNLLQKADGSTGGVGSILRVPKKDGFSDGLLSTGESVDVNFVICLTELSPFRFFVDVLGKVQ